MHHLSRFVIAVGLALFALGGQVLAQSLKFDNQRASIYRPAAGQVLAGASGASHAAVVRDFLASRGATPASVAALQQTQAQLSPSMEHVRLEQQVGGLTVAGSYVKAAFNVRGELVQVIAKLAPVMTPAAASTSELRALQAAMARLHPGVQANFVLAERSGNTARFSGGSFFYRDPEVTKVVIAMDDGSLAVGHRVETWSRAANLLHYTLVGSGGRVLAVEKRTNNDSYNVFLEDPSKGGQTIVAGPAPGGTQSPAGWLGPGSQSTILISGNNVSSYLDAMENNQADKGGTSVADGNFLTAWNGTLSPSVPGNMAVAVQNLFFLNNVVHDTLYTKGFTEAAGNFQIDNFGRGGKGGDSVNAEAQDGGGLDNANFSTPVDGKSPRMQMFLWTGPGATDEVVVNSPVSATYDATPAIWGPSIDKKLIAGTVAFVDDGVGTLTDGCEPIAANLRGLIALVDRGTCNFTVKAVNAQRAGAIALIVANNRPDPIIVMGGDDPSVHIPALMISQADGAALRGITSPNVTMRVKAVQPLQLDGSLDADVVFHEYGHGLTWRMIGGMSGPLAGAIGEGASDTVAMMINGDDRIGEYSSSNPNGIRRAPYAGYPRTYKDVTGAEVHDDGEIYAAAMWRLIELFGAAGHEQLFAYFVDGMNFTPSTPAYEDMRDGMLQAIANSTASATDCGLVWQGFAERGIGAGASGVVNADGSVTITETFTNPGNTCTIP